MVYAKYTEISFEQTLTDIQALLRKRGAGQIISGEEAERYAIQFSLADRMIRFRLSLSDRSNRNQEIVRKERARALLLVIKAKLESVDAGIESIEQAFLAHVVMSDGRTVHERIVEPLALEYQTGKPVSAAGLLPPPDRG